MPTYVTLWDYTQKGVGNIKDSPSRLDRAISVIESVDGELQDFYLTMGGHDIVTVTEFPDDDAAASAMLRIARGGSVTPQTMKAWPEAESRELIGAL
jgi:uncharacterized protein with GYD domain